MAGPEFFQTLMGRKFYEGTMPDLVRQLERLNKNLEKAMSESVSVEGVKTELNALKEVVKQFDPNNPQEFLEKLRELEK